MDGFRWMKPQSGLHLLVKNDGLGPVNKNFVLQMQTQSACQHNPFKVFAFGLDIRNRVTVADLDDILGNDRPFIELLGDIMSCCPDNLNASVIRLLIRIAAGKSRQEGMMNIDDPVVTILQKFPG